METIPALVVAGIVSLVVFLIGLAVVRAIDRYEDPKPPPPDMDQLLEMFPD